VDFLAERMTRQGLAARSMATTAGVAAAAVGLQAQDPGLRWMTTLFGPMIERTYR
jgi:type IV secretory pathway TrbD component